MSEVTQQDRPILDPRRVARMVATIALGTLSVVACSDLDTAPTGADSLAAGGASLQIGQASDVVPGRVLVGFTPGANPAAIANRNAASLDRPLRLAGAWVLNVPAGREATIAEALSRNPNVSFAEPDFIRTYGNPCETTGCIKPSDTYFGYKWDLHNDGTITTSTGVDEMATGKVDADIDWLEAFDQLGGGFAGSATIGIIDSGVYGGHPDLAGRVLAGYDFVDNDSDPMDEDGHGTHVAGIAAGSGNDGNGVTGVAWGSNVKILPVRVCGPNGCPTSAIVDGIVWATDNGANVLNLSLGGRFGSTAEQQALAYALSQDVLPFCATGNDGSGKVSYPAAFAECVAVGATDWNDDRASYSNAGSETELAAPGGDSEDPNGRSYILSSYFDGGYVFMAGTSMATPQATGLAALLHANGVVGASTIRNRMTSTADDLGSAGRDRNFGFGRINVYRALNNLTAGGGSGGGDGGGGGETPCRGGPKKCG